MSTLSSDTFSIANDGELYDPEIYRLFVQFSEELIAEEKAKSAKMCEWIKTICYCPCCQEYQTCASGCTFALDSPEGEEYMRYAREVLYGQRN